MLGRAFLPLVAVALATGCTVHAEVGSKTAQAHPAYLTALSDLREARAEIAGRGGSGNAQNDENNAVAEIDRAINELKQASIDDGKNLNDHPAVDANEPAVGRLHKGLAALQRAKQDIDHEEDNGNARQWRGRAVGNIDAAINATNNAIRQF